MKHQKQKTKHRETIKLQTSSNVKRSIREFAEMNLMRRTGLLKVGTWFLLGVWVLVFGVFFTA
jgi:hypothetical protein